MTTIIKLEPRPRSNSPEFPYYLALNMAVARMLTAMGWETGFDLGDTRGDVHLPGEEDPHLRVSSGNVYEILASIKTQPFVVDATSDGFTITVTVSTYVGASVQTMRLPTPPGGYRLIGFPHPLGGNAIAEAVIIARAGFVVTGFLVLDGTVTATFTGLLDASSVRRLTDAYRQIDEILTEEATSANLFGDLTEGSSISFPDGIPLPALETAFLYAQAGVPVVGFAVGPGVFEPHASGPLTPEVLEAMAQQFTLEME